MLDENLIALLADNGIEINRDLCQNIDKPSVRIVYQRYISANDIIRKIDLLCKDQSWVGPNPSQTEIIRLFIAKSTWHKSYATKIPPAERHEDMRAWLAQEDGCLTDTELWGEAKDNYVMKDLEEWLVERDGKKTKVIGKAKAKDIVKGKAKAQQTANTAMGKGKVQASTEKQEESRATKTQHKKKTTRG